MKKGSKHTIKTKRKISEALKGYIVTEETKKKISEARKGKSWGHHDEESKQKMSRNHADCSGKNNPMYDVHRMGKNSPRYKHGLTGTEDYTKKYRKEYQENNRSKINAHTAKRRAWKLSQTSSDADMIEIQKIYFMAALMNKISTGIKWHVDHIIPLSKGGLHHQDNLQILEARINLRKGDKII